MNKDLDMSFLNRIKTDTTDGTAIKPEHIPDVLRKFMVSGPVIEKIQQSPGDEHDALVMAAIKGAQKYIPAFKKATPGPARAKVLYNMLDEKNNGPDGIPNTMPISCRVSCNHCCYLAVYISDDEADLLANKIKSKEVEVDMDLLKLQATRGGDPDGWIGKPLNEAKCVFLGGLGSCMVYKDRPSVCRNYFVISPAKDCDTSTKGTHKVVRPIDNEAEYMLAAGQSFQRTVGTLPQKLWERLKKK
jgi:Fe-S-cluster containining protein